MTVRQSRYDSLRPLLDHLKREHRRGVVYRGQTRPYESPLVPSEYRPYVTQSRYVPRSPGTRLREIGEVFYELSGPPQVVISAEDQRQMEANQAFRQLFGYPVYQLLAQQFGYRSGGLDVTSDPEAAAFFAIFDLRQRAYVAGSEAPGVIYRFQVSTEPLSLQCLSLRDFYGCPTYFLDAEAALCLLGECGSWDKAMESFVNYYTAPMESVPPLKPLHLSCEFQ